MSISLFSILSVFFGGGFGSLCRFFVSRLTVAAYSSPKFPLATFLANLFACVLMAAVIYFTARHRTISDTWSAFWLIGFCGGFSTFSTFSYENWLLYRDASYGMLALNIFLSVVLCFGVFLFAGRHISASGG